MAYEVTIRCDVGEGNRLTKDRCHNDAQARARVIRTEQRLGGDAVRIAEQEALRGGWKRQRRASRPSQWVCPVCATKP